MPVLKQRNENLYFTKGKDKYTFKFACVDELNVVAEVALFVGIIRSCLPGTDIISILSSRGLEISDKELAVAMNRTWTEHEPKCKNWGIP